MTITVYSLPISQCVNCRGVEISMSRKGIDFVKVRLDEDPSAMDIVKKLGYTSAPVVVVEEDGKVVDHWSGFSETKIAALKDQRVA